MWRSFYYLLRSVYPALRALRLADSNKPGMDKIYYYSNKTSIALEKSASFLNDPVYFPLTNEDEVEVDSDSESNTDSESNFDSDSEPDADELSYNSDNNLKEIGSEIVNIWNKRKEKVESD